MTREVSYTHDLETTPLQIKTDSAVGSEEQVGVAFSKADDDVYSGGISLKFTDPPEYFIKRCFEISASFSVDLPAEQTKIWTITKTAITVKISCNEVEVLTYIFSDSSRSACVTYWSSDTVKILFGSTDTASDEFRALPGTLCSTLKVNIGTNITNNVKL